ncbi:hypothetical protein Mapa_008161 [Marchantia paleacea]|nr:hypothetical protein Mapa_008161 [Marchantia paleacea]
MWQPSHLTDIPQITIKHTTMLRNPFHRLFPNRNKEQTLIYCNISSYYLRSLLGLTKKMFAKPVTAIQL